MAIYKKVTVEQTEKALLYIDGRLDRVLDPGVYRIVRPLKKVRVLRIDMRVTDMHVAGQELMTADKVTLRVTLIGRYRVRDPDLAIHAVDSYTAQLYTDLQLGLRALTGALTLDEMLAKKAALGRRIVTDIRDRVEAYGVELKDAGVKDLVLPGDMKRIYNQVIEARKRAEASQIERREEVAATRTLANTADLLAKNPTLMKLKEMEMLEKVLGAGQSKMLVGLPKGMLKLLGLDDN